MPVIGFLSSRSPAESRSSLAAFRQGLGQVGYFEGKNVAIEYRWAEGQYDRLPALAADLARRQVRAIIANVTSARATLSVTTTIPIILATAADPVEQGLVASLGRPGGNLTGATSASSEIAPKLLE